MFPVGPNTQEIGKAALPTQVVNASPTFYLSHNISDGSSYQKHLDTQTGMYLTPSQSMTYM